MSNSALSGTGEIVPQLQLEVAIARAKELLKSTREVFDQQSIIGNSGHRWRIDKDFDQVETLLNEIEPRYVSDKQAKRVALALIVDLPKWFSGYMEKIVKLGVYKAKEHPRVIRVRNEITGKLRKAIQDQPTLRVQYSMHAITQKAAREIASKPQADAANAGPTAEFPAAPWISKEFSARWKQISEQWYSAYAAATGVEDRFRLEQLATVHLPDSLNMFAELADAAPEVKAEAQELLTQQLVAAERQIEISSQRQSKDALTALRAQTAFMQEIAKLPQNSGILLPEPSKA